MVSARSTAKFALQLWRLIPIRNKLPHAFASKHSIHDDSKHKKYKLQNDLGMDFQPSLYSKITSVTQRGAEEALQRLASRLPRAEIILDLGSGSGEVSGLVVDSIPHNRFIAVDVDAAMLEFHQANHSRKSVEYVQQDMGASFPSLDPSLQELEGKVDLIWSNYSLQWIPSANKGNASLNIWKLLKPGGLAYLNIVHLPAKILHFCENSKVRSYLRVPSYEEQMAEWQRSLSIAGFTSVRVTGSQKKHEYETVEQFQTTRKLSKVYGVYLNDDVVGSERKRILESLEEPFLRTFAEPLHSKSNKNLREIKTYWYNLITVEAVR